jgi:RNA polymerase sigma-70 factor, ECF subfamily
VVSEHAPDAARRLTDARAGSGEALGQALEACRAYLLLVAKRELNPDLQAKGGASDLVQETLVDALRDFRRFQGQSEAELRVWLRKLLLHNLVDFTRHYRQVEKRQIDREVDLEAGNSSAERGGDLEAPTPSPSGQAIQDEQSQAIERALGRLPEDYRRVLQLRFEEDRSFEEIGVILKLTPNAARKLWTRAVKRLQRESEGLQ